MKIKSFTFNPFSTNCYVVSSGTSAVLIDPSSHEKGEHQAVVSHVETSGVTIERILLTHGHIDHILGCRYMVDHFGVGYEIHRADLPLMTRAMDQAAMFGIRMDQPPEPVRFIEEGEQVLFGDVTWDVIHTPGHSPGSVSFVDHANRLAISGDVLFAGSIGRTDLWQGSLPVLMTSIFDGLMSLDDDFSVLSGHGPETTVGVERTRNPFLTGGM